MVGRVARRVRHTVFIGLSLWVSTTYAGTDSTAAAVQDRIAADVTAGRPIVVHVVVALCDNENQGIVPVPAHLGDGQDPTSNLYWGALYGVRTHLTQAAGWKRVSTEVPVDVKVLERIVLKKSVQRDGRGVPVYIVADAWDGAHIQTAVARFLDMAAGRAAESVGADSLVLGAGGEAHLVSYVGHNGLMDFDLSAPAAEPKAVSRAAVVLACKSKSYFLDKLRAADAQPLLLTTGLMAPEAYTLDAIVTSWCSGAMGADVKNAAAQAYHRYQKCGLTAARRLFWSGSER